MFIEGEGAAGQPAGSDIVADPSNQTPSGSSPQGGGGGEPAAPAAATPDANAPGKAESPSALPDQNAKDPKETPPPAIRQEPARPWHEEVAEKYGITDEKILGKMKRYADFKAYAESVRELEKTFSAGDRGKLPENPTDEQLKQYREANGIPTDASGYDSAFEIGEGYHISDDEKQALAERLIKPLHDVNAKPEVAKAAVKAFMDYLGDAHEQVRQRDEAVHGELRAEWGNDYDKNKNQIETMFSTYFGPAADKMRSIMSLDGKGFAVADKELMNAFLSVANKLNPAASMPPATGHRDAQVDRIAEIENVMRTNIYAYERDMGLKKEYRELIAQRDAGNARK